MSDKAVRELFDINVFGLLNVIRSALPIMRKQNSGHIFNVSSFGAYNVGPLSGPYCATRKIDFVVNSGGKRTYIQSAYAMPTEEKAEVELKPFTLTGDSFPKIVVRKDIGKRWYDDNGILNINVIDFLLDKELI